MAEPVEIVAKISALRGARDERLRAQGARPLFARAPESVSLLPYREGKAASTFTAIGSSACTVGLVCDSFSFFCLNIIKEKVSMPSARVFMDKRSSWFVFLRVWIACLIVGISSPIAAHDLHYVDRAKLGKFKFTLSSWYAPSDDGRGELWSYPSGASPSQPTAVPTGGWVRIWMFYEFSGKLNDALRLSCVVKVRRPDGKVKKYRPYLCLNERHDGNSGMVDLRMRSRFDPGDQPGVWETIVNVYQEDKSTVRLHVGSVHTGKGQD
jgi:hypothetical protein